MGQCVCGVNDGHKYKEPCYCGGSPVKSELRNKFKIIFLSNCQISKSTKSPRKNIAVLGAGYVGKSALTVRMIANEWCPPYDEFVPDWYSIMIDIDGRQVPLDIKETDTSEQFAAMHPSPNLQLCRESDQFMIVYSIRSMESFKHAQCLYKSLCRIKKDMRMDVVLVGNKSDLYDGMSVIYQMELDNEKIKCLVSGFIKRIEKECISNDYRQIVIMPDEVKDICVSYVGDLTKIKVPYRYGKQLAENWGVPFFETSAKTGENVEEAFKCLVMM